MRTLRPLLTAVLAATATLAVVVAPQSGAGASGTLDEAAVLAAPRPTCEIVLTPSTIPSSQDVVVSGQITGLLMLRLAARVRSRRIHRS